MPLARTAALFLLTWCAVGGVACGSAGNINLLPGGGGAGGSVGGCSASCSGETPLCDTQSGACVQCLAPTDCSANQTCSPGTQRCVLRCSTNADCTNSAQPYCDTSGGMCVQCLQNSQCAGGSCTNFKCDN